MKKLTFPLLVVIIVFITSCKGQPNSADENQTTVESAQKEQKKRKGKRGRRSMGNETGEEYKGVFTSGGKRDLLFPIRSTGASTAEIVSTAKEFLAGLTDEQKKKTIYTISDEEWHKWSNVDNGIYKRAGISIKEMTQEQRKLADELLASSLSAKGVQLSKDIMKTDQTLHELNNNSDSFDEELYYFTIMGEPSDTEPWGWQLDGHHLVINYFVLGDQVVMTPTFLGGEPIITTSGKYKGNTLFQDEQNIGLKFMQSLTKDQQAKATLSTTKDRENMQAAAGADNLKLDFAGLSMKELSTTKKVELLALANLYISNMTDAHAKVKMSEIERHIDETYFAWAGATGDDAVFYYRIHSPVILIEFDHQGPVGVRTPGQGRGATRNHIHTMIRTPNGNDYGRDLLRQHLDTHH